MQIFDELVHSRGSGPNALAKKDWQPSGRFPVIGQGADQIEGWTDREDLAIQVNEPLVIYGGHTRRAKLVRSDFVPGPNAKILRPTNKIIPEFLFHFLSFLRVEDKGYADHFPLVRKSLVPVPTLDEQRRIVAVLDQVVAAIDRASALVEANLADAEELFERQLASAFEQTAASAKLLPFDKLCKALTPKTKIKRKDYLEQGDHPIVSQEADLISGYWNDETALMGLDQPVVVFGDHTRCLKYVDFDFVVGADGTKVLKSQDGIDPLYLYYGLRSIPVAEKGYARHFRFLKEAVLPDLDERAQRELAKKLGEVEAKAMDLADEYEAKLDDLDNLRQSLLQKAFAGELT